MTLRTLSISRVAAEDRRSKQSVRAGFTIIEILVVVSIIVILVAMVIAVGAGVKSSAQRNQTKLTLKAMKAVYDSYVLETGQSDTTNQAAPVFLSVAASMPSLSKAMNAMPANSYSNGAAYDGFGNKIFIANTTTKGVYFQSAGPNGVMGTQATPDSDDMFSYDP